uniref:Putative secreted protein n=1 Tax=Anopheles darlingi TaxID=43151 RepID=A0A2M4DIG3_ANODA
MHRSWVDLLIAQVLVVIDDLVRVHLLHLVGHAHALVVHHPLVAHVTAAGLWLHRTRRIPVPSGGTHLVECAWLTVK